MRPVDQLTSDVPQARRRPRPCGLRHRVIVDEALTVPGARNPEQSMANTVAMREVISEEFWRELTPLIQDFDIALPPK